jgi:tRNA-specific 2-thiouridylase
MLIGRHNGVHCFTVGQRKGLGIAWKHPLHVIEIDVTGNRIVVGSRDEMFRSVLTAGNAVWGVSPATNEFRATCRIRYRHQPAPCRVVMFADNRFEVHFDTPQMAITQGQAAVLYDGERVLGGGWIE